MNAPKLIVSIPRNEDGTPKHDLIKVSSKNPEWCGILVKSSIMRTSRTKTGGFVIDESTRSAYVQIKTEVANKLGLHEGSDLNAFGLDLTIARKESREPQYEGHQAKVNPTTGEIVLVDGAPVYMNDYIAPSGTSDELIRANQGASVSAPAVTEAGAL
jgi:hypothetical protein